MMRLFAALLTALVAAMAQAQEAPMPRERPAATDEGVIASGTVPLPRPRPEPSEDEPARLATPAPEVPPPRIYQSACPAVIRGQVDARMMPPISEAQCGVRSPLAVSNLIVNGRSVPLSGEATLTCGMAESLADWAAAVDGYLAARERTRIARILTGTSYSCRPRNNAKGADLSEHAFGNALDIIGFELEDGRTMSLPDGWNVPLAPAGRLLRFAHDAGCARFTTTLGPEANALHADHLHLDLGCHGENCTARLCE
jgi:hypothetical protein